MIKDVISVGKMEESYFLPTLKITSLNDVIALRLFIQMQRETEKLKKRISQNMFDDLQKHRAALNVLSKQLFVKGIPNATENLDLRPSQSPGIGRSNLAPISNSGDDSIAPIAGAFASVLNQIFSHVGYIFHRSLSQRF